MNNVEKVLLWATAVVAVVALSTIGGALAGRLVVQKALLRIDAEPAQAKVIFPRPDQVEVQVPSVIRGQRITCIIVADTKRRISSVSC